LICPAVPPAIPTFNPISCTVNCAQGGTIASALSLRARSTNNFTITINGTCVESVDHVPSGVTLQAGMSGATLQAPNSSTDPVLGISGIGVTLTGLTISGGIYGLRGHPGAVFTGTNLVVEGASTYDVYLNHATATLTNPTVQNSSDTGIEVEHNGALFLNGGFVQNNSNIGVNVVYNGAADVYGNAVVQNNNSYGTGSGYGGTVHIYAATVTNNITADGGGGVNAGTGGHVVVEGPSTVVSRNHGSGIAVYDGGDALVENGVTVTSNLGNGVTLSQGAFAKLRLGTVIHGNGAQGVYVDSGTVTLGDTSGPVTIENNALNGVLLRSNSVAILDSSSSQIINNTQWGIFCAGAPANPLLVEYAVLTVSGNGSGQIHCNVSP
jgi:hypothetical protein